MRKHVDTSARTRRRGWSLCGLAALSTLLLAGCANVTTSISDGWLPVAENGEPATPEAGRVINLWVGNWITALLVGLLVWGLTIWCIVAYRNRKGDRGLPPQLRYNVPIELLYTVVPVLMVAVLFYYTARDEAVLLDTSPEPDVTVNVVAKQWSWDFNYVKENVYETGVHTEINSQQAGGTPQPVLYLPVDNRVEFVINARDVVHSFWVPVFLMKVDAVPGKTNHFQVTPTQVGEFQGKCSELCGAYHAQMLFKVKVVPQAEYDAHIATLRQLGQVGQLDNSLNREPVHSDDLRLVPTPPGSSS